MPPTAILDYAYRPEQHALEITFISGRRYRYHDVPEALYRDMRDAFSKGEFFNRHIRDRFAFDGPLN
jgi:lysyl-tRNA synthetase class 2